MDITDSALRLYIGHARIVPSEFTDADSLGLARRKRGHLCVLRKERDDVLFGLAKFIIPWLGDEVRICDLTFDYFVLMVSGCNVPKRPVIGATGWWLGAVATAACHGTGRCWIASSASVINSRGRMRPFGEPPLPFLQTIIRRTGASLRDPEVLPVLTSEP
jgi:hypothetical protein